MKIGIESAKKAHIIASILLYLLFLPWGVYRIINPTFVLINRGTIFDSLLSLIVLLAVVLPPIIGVLSLIYYSLKNERGRILFLSVFNIVFFSLYFVWSMPLRMTLWVMLMLSIIIVLSGFFLHWISKRDKGPIILIVVFFVIIPVLCMWLFGMFSPPEKPNPYVFGFGRIGVLENSVKYSGNTLEFNIVNRTGVTMYDLTIDALEGSCQNGTVYVDYIGMENREEYGIMYAVKIANCDFKEPGDSFGVHLQIDYNETFIGNKISRSARGTLLGSAE